jgi:heme exporter protein CcmD
MGFQFDSLYSFLNMAGHGIYVWSVVVITVIVLSGLIIWPLRAHSLALAEQQRLQRIAEARKVQLGKQTT